jgi:hypothetical protein
MANTKWRTDKVLLGTRTYAGLDFDSLRVDPLGSQITTNDWVILAWFVWLAIVTISTRDKMVFCTFRVVSLK